MKSFLALAILFKSGLALACTCLPIHTAVKENLQRSDEVFIGIPVDSIVGKTVITEFRVIKSYKGTSDNLVVNTAKSSPACGLIFGKHKGPYLVFAYKNTQGELSTNLCSAGAYGPNSKRVIKATLQLEDLK